MKSVISGVAVPLVAFAVLAAGAPIAWATDTGQPYPSTTAGVVLLSDSVKPSGKPKPPQLSEEEKRAIEDMEAGRGYDPAVFKQARNKLVQGEKYSGERNKRKRRK